MAKRSHEDWMDLINQQPASGLSIANFCRQHKLSTSSFYTRKAAIDEVNTQTVEPFVKATVAASTEAISQTYASEQTISLQHQTGTWTFPSSQPASYLLEIIKGLQSC